MDIDNILNDIVNDDNAAAGGEDQETAPVLDYLPLIDLIKSDLQNEDIKSAIYDRFKDDIEIYIDDYLTRCKDPQAVNGMIKCCLETWQACITDIGRNYFLKNKYLKDLNKIAAGGGVAYHDDLLSIALELYEYLCYEYKKQFFIYDACRFMGISKDLMFRLSELHSELLKKAHACQESSMRSALASGRSNVTAMAILLNHDYDYTRTTQVIHSTSSDRLSADRLPDLMQPTPQHIVLTDNIIEAPAIPDDM